MSEDKRIFKRPKYKIGDIIVYIKNDGNEDSIALMQEKVIGADALVDIDDKNDTLTWYYTTKESVYEDALTEENILYKIDE